jgi:hypothetical protein
MTKKSILVIILFAAFLSASCYYNPSERNRIEFKDNFTNVQTALFKMEKLIKKLPSSEVNINYEFKNDSITINDSPKQDSSQYFTNQELAAFAESERKEFLMLAKYLSNNYISAGYLHYNSDVCLFIYRNLPENTFDDSRNIAFLKDAENTVHKSESKILDKKGCLMLVAPIDAKIYNNYTLVDDKK